MSTCLVNQPDKISYSGNGTEQENLRAEKEFEAAAAKGLRPCMFFYLPFNSHLIISLVGPTCKKMTDLSAAKTFKSIAFEPSDEELTKAAKARRKQKAKGDQEELSSEDEIVIDSPVHKIFTGSALDLDDSSDEDLPDVTDLLSGHKGKKETKAEPKKKKSKPTKKKIKFSKKKAPVEDVCCHFVHFDLNLILFCLGRFGRPHNG